MKSPTILALLLTALAAADATEAEAVDSGSIEPGESFDHTFTQKGAFEYHCHPHPWMTARLMIMEAPTDTVPAQHTVRIIEPSSDTSTWAFAPQDLTIHAGDRVTWVNEGTSIHTVTGSIGTGHDDHGHDHGHDHDHQADGQDSPAPLLVLPLAFSLLLMRRG